MRKERHVHLQKPKWESYLLRIGGYINIVIAIAHLVGLIWADQMYEFSGVGRQMEDLSRIHSAYPFLLTLFVSLVFFLFGLYGLSAGEEIVQLPFLQNCIYLIATIYILRGLGGLALEKFHDFPSSNQVIFSSTAATIGLFYLVGALVKWNRKPVKSPITPNKAKE